MEENGKNIIKLFRSWYKIYGKSVVLSRAIPHYLDGLKPVQRRLLYVIFREGYTKKLVKSTAICADTQKYFHPHGEMAVYNALVKLSQTFHTRLSVIETQGNWGSSDGDAAAASRYTECKGGKLINLYTENLKTDIVPMITNYAGSDLEPEFLPVRLPMLLINGSQGIAVGYATSIPPFNPKEIIDYLKSLINNEKVELSDIIKGPDFPEGGSVLLDKDQHKKILNTGRGSYKLRADYWIEEKGDNCLIHFQNTPYRYNRSDILKEIIALINSKELYGVLAVTDFSDRRGIDLVLKVKSNLKNYVLEQLFQKTNLEVFISVNLVCVKDNKPQVLSVKQILEDFLTMRFKIVTKLARKNVRDLEIKLHRLKVNLALRENLNQVINIVKNSQEPMKDLSKLIFNLDSNYFEKNFYLNPEDIDYLLSIPLSRLRVTAYKENINDVKEFFNQKKEQEEILENREKLKKVVFQDLIEVENLIENTSLRKSKIISLEENTPEEVIILLYKNNFASKQFLSEVTSQKRGGKGKKLVKDVDLKPINLIKVENSKNNVFITNLGRILRFNISKIPFYNQEELFYLGNDFAFKEGEFLQQTLILNQDLLLIVTDRGKVKLINFKDWNGRTKKLISLQENENVIKILSVNQEDEVILFSNAKAIRFKVKDLRISNLGSGGVRGINLKEGEFLVGTVIGKADDSFITIRSGGWGKLDNVSNYKLQKRGGVGLSVMWKNLPIIGLGQDKDILICLMEDGKIIRTDLSELKLSSRKNKGVKLIDIDSSQIISSI